MYYFPTQAAALLGVRYKRLQEYIRTSGIGRWSRAPKRLMLSDKDLLAIWGDSDLMAKLTKKLWELRPPRPKKHYVYPYVYRYRYRPYKPIPLEDQKPRGGARPGAGRKRNTEFRTKGRGNPWAQLLKKDGLL